MTRNLFLIIGLFVCCAGWFNVCFAVTTDTQVDISDRIKLTQSGLVLNRATRTYDTTISLKNITNTPMPGPIMVSVNALNPNTVTLANATGTSATGSTISALSAQESLNSGQSIGNIILKFKNPNNVKFTFKTSVLGVVPSQQGVNNVSSLFPTSGYSGTVVTVTGNNFLPYSVITFGDRTIQNFEYLSPQQIQFVVPLAVNQNGNLVSLNHGDYQVTIDGGVNSNFTVTELPANPNPPGMVMNNTIQQLKQFVIQNQSSYDYSIGLLKTQQLDQNLLEILNSVSDIDNLLIEILNTDLPNAVSNLDHDSLDTIERLLLANQAESMQIASGINQKNNILNNINRTYFYTLVSNIFGIKQALASTSTPDLYPGNAWLDSRMEVTYLSKLNGILGNIILGSSVAAPVAGVAAAPEVVISMVILNLVNAGSSLLEDIISATEGTINTFDIGAINATETTMDAGVVSPRKLITMDVSSSDSELGQARYFIEPQIQVEYAFDVPKILEHLSGPATLYFSSINLEPTTFTSYLLSGIGVINKVRDLLALDQGGKREIMPTSAPLNISLDRVEWDDDKALSPLIPEFLTPLCQDTSFKNKISIAADGFVSVNQNAPASLSPINCFARVARAYRTQSEISAYVGTQFFINKYNRLALTITGNQTGTVVATSPEPKVAPNSSACLSGRFSGTCYLYFYEGVDVYLFATSDPGAFFTGWSEGTCNSKTVASDGSKGTCMVAMDGNSKNVTATFGDIFVGRWIGKMNNGSDAAITIYKGANSGEYFFNYPNWKPALADGNTLYWNGVTFDSSGCFGKRQTMTLTISVNAGVLVLKKFVEEKMIHPECSGFSGLTWEESFTGKRS